MILFDRKKAMNQIMGPAPDQEEKKAEGGIHPHALAIAKEAMDAIHNHDHEAYASASQAMHLFHQSHLDPDQDGDVHDPVTGKEE